jgi:hypothetical protein
MAGLDLAVICNCTIASVISLTGRHGWFCFPRLDADPVFNALLGGTAPELACLDARLHGQTVARQRYLPNTAVLTDAEGGKARVLDFCPPLPPLRSHDPATDTGPPDRAARWAAAHHSRATAELRVRHHRPRCQYRRQPYALYRPGPGAARYHRHAAVLSRARGRFRSGPPINLFIGADETVPEALEMLIRQFLDETVGYRRDWVRDLNMPFDWQEAVIRAAITLKLCSYGDTGAIVAALSTSIPESPGSGCTWDYRYCWLRDAYFTVAALNRLSAARTMEAFLRFILDVVQREGDAGLAPPYPIAPIEKYLVRNGFVLRYVPEDEFGKPDSAFLVCTFWYIDALASVGRRDESLALFENVLAHRNHLGLLSEDIAPATGVLWDNFPQTYSQVGLIFAAMRLSRAWEEGMWRAS